MNNYAVFVQNADKSYGARQVLQNFNMQVLKGSIYGLLGASGCGKTTLLSCIAGRKKLDAGSIWVVGGEPGSEESGVPGPRVGYMPQDIALVGEFSVKGAVYYFGKIFNMPEKKINERYEFLKNILDLPPDDRMIKNCSGGQQRRVSFAAAMVHEPELLILDEPTVGLDPVLRDSIWNHLVELAHKHNTAIIITTHYIEEARQADRIGLMRGGRLLAEDSPDRLLIAYNTDSLEEVFLKLSQKQEDGAFGDPNNPPDVQDNGRIQSAYSETSIALSDLGHRSTDMLTKLSEPNKKKKQKRAYTINKHHIKALMWKNYLQYFKNTAGLLFNLMFAILEMLAFLNAIGGDIKSIGIGVVNSEHMMDTCNRYLRQNTAIPHGFVDCDFHQLSCRFLEDMEDPMIKKVYYDNLESAFEGTSHGAVVGVMYFSENFTDAFQKRLEKGNSVDNETLSLSEIQVWLDMSNRQIGQTLKFKLLSLFLDFQKSLINDCNLFEKLADIPIDFNYEYGNDKTTFTVFMIPGVLITIMFFLGTTMTSSIMIQDRLEGVWDRSIVAGVSSVEIVLTHFITQFIIICIQVIEVMIITFLFYKIEYVGNIALITFMVVLQGVCGMVFGFWISIISENHNMANIIATGTFYPIILLCGLVWPLEGQPTVLRFISKCLPFTVAIESLRNVMRKGWGVVNLDVLNGIGISLAWIVGLSIISILLVKRKR
ncbi:ABC transporter G family member 20-like [Onthophagus taurus]|uniref:ABC transporter G family member 20-like n=1 Tax=Onthophagus taurus TaxID=166361 RepID=UPI000C207B89|nr:ABC transporter G family member 20-like [Onthophagus taurus]